MRQFELQVMETAALGGLVRVTCAGPDAGARPGQVCLALAEIAGQPFLREALYMAGGPGRPQTFLTAAGHAYARLAPGDRLDVIGPLGRGFRLPPGAGRLLVMASGLERLLPTIEHAVTAGLAVTVMTPRGASALPPEVEVHRGALTAELAAWADAALLDVADPAARARAIRALVPPRGAEFVQALFSPPLPCGVGACQACWIEAAPGRGRKLACKDGPVFML